MKILVILTYYYPHWTGLTAYARRLAEGLAARGHQVTVLTSRHSPDLPSHEIVGGVRIVRLNPVARVSRGMLMPVFPVAAARMIRDHDVVQIHTPLLESLLVALLCRLLGRPLLLTHHGDLIMPQGAFNQFVQLVVRAMMGWAGRLATAVSSYSRDYAGHSTFLKPFAHKLSYIYPPVEIPAPDLRQVADWKRSLELEGKILIGFAGRWVEEKGFDYLLEAMPLVRAEIPNAHFVFAGEHKVVYENFFERCRPLVEANRDWLTILGLITDSQQLANFYAMCDLFVLPSRSDCLAIVQIEALLCGTPVVATDIPGARVVVRETGFGRLAEPHNPPALAREILAALHERERYRPTESAVRQVFNTAATIDAFEHLFARLAGYAFPAHSSTSPTNTLLPTRASNGHPFTPATRAKPSYRYLNADDQATLDRLLRNEADMAFRRRARTLLDYLELADGARVLDCGCGMGVYLMMLGKLRRLRLYGLDGSIERLRWARREQVPAELTRTDITRLPFPDNTFDRVLMSEVLEHIGDDRKAVVEVLRVLRPGGILALSVPHANYPFWWDPINATIEACGGSPLRSAGPITGLWSQHWRLYRPDELREIMTSAGFLVEALEEQTHYSFPFIHLAVYSVGKPLIEHNLLPSNLRASADRFRGEQNSGSLLNPINLGLAAFRSFDQRNEQLNGHERTFVNLVVKARKP